MNLLDLQDEGEEFTPVKRGWRKRRRPVKIATLKPTEPEESDEESNSDTNQEKQTQRSELGIQTDITLPQRVECNWIAEITSMNDVDEVPVLPKAAEATILLPKAGTAEVNIDIDIPVLPEAAEEVLQPKAGTGKKLLEDMCVKAINGMSPKEQATDARVEMEIGDHAEAAEDEVGGVTIGVLGHCVGEDFVNPPGWKDPDEYRSDPRKVRDDGCTQRPRRRRRSKFSWSANG